MIQKRSCSLSTKVHDENPPDYDNVNIFNIYES